MARADTSPKAIIKAAIRNKCHVIVQRYPHQRLETLHGSNVKWLVLSDELFHEVCSEFTIQKLEMNYAEKRALFDADWVPQVTYELITKPSRPRRRRSHQIETGRYFYPGMPLEDPSMIFGGPWRRASADTLHGFAVPPFIQPYPCPPIVKTEEMNYEARSRMTSIASTSSFGSSPVSPAASSEGMIFSQMPVTPDDQASSGRANFFDTVLN